MAKLYFYYASMNAGKSTTLLQADFNYRERGMETMLYTAAIDDRAGPRRDRLPDRAPRSAAISIFPHTDLRAEAEEELKKRALHLILAHEAQFLTRAQVVQLASICEELDIPVLAYGLRTDFQANLFEGSAHLLALADTLVELKAVCECGRKATMNLRVDEDGRAVKPRRLDRDRRQRSLYLALPPPFHGPDRRSRRRAIASRFDPRRRLGALNRKSPVPISS